MPKSSASPLETVAARRARGSGVYQTSPGLLRRRLIGPWGEGLAQYLALRVGSERGRLAYGALCRMLSSLPPSELVEAPGPKARLYRLARSIAETERAMPGKPISWSALPFRRYEGSRGAALRALRAALTPIDAELLELHYARELNIEEIAFVLETAKDDVELALDTAQARARRVLGAHAPDPIEPCASVFVDAFALASSDELEDPIAEEAALAPGTVIGGRYRLGEHVGIGAFGDVYRAEDTEVPGHRVALKLLRQPSLSESARREALRELRLNAAVFHPSLVQFKDHGWYEERLWFVMPWYEGETLDARMERSPLSRKEAQRIFEPLARALAAMHEAGIRHQDIKPDNILLTELPGGDDQILPVLIDLGVAVHDQECLLGGTPLYFAPEVAARFTSDDDSPDAPIGPAADVFALALSLRNALEPETQDDVPAGAIRAFVARRASERPSLPTSRSLRYLRPYFARWLSADPAERPTAEELAAELAVLTMPEERRARRIRIARWLIPFLFGLATVFAAVVRQLDQRAALGELRAQRARAAAAVAHADLIVADARRRALETGNAELQTRYEQSTLSRRELAQQLATMETQLELLRGELASSIDAARTAQLRLDETRHALGERESELDAAQHETAERTSELEASRAETRRRESEANDLRARNRDLGTQIATERSARRDAEEQAVALTAQLAEARRTRDAAEQELARVRENVDRLAASIRARDESTAEPTTSDEPP